MLGADPSRRKSWKGGRVLALIATSVSLAAQDPPPPPVPFQQEQAPAAGPAPNAGPNEPEVLTRGPVHEAFAEPVTFDPKPGPAAPKAPPAPIEELPPDQKPAGDNVQWIPGYWHWDEERDDYLWVSGIWRAVPPGRQWVPGYWDAQAGSPRWISGYWAPVEQQAIEYLPTPPASLEVGPNTPAPSAQGYVWAPGCWQWSGQRYVWSPGVWVVSQPEWLWVPPTYAYTPGGCVFVPGYWDYIPTRRGLIFAPVYLPPQVYVQPGFVYTPAVNLNVAVMTNHFFARPVYGHYYFGDYYGPSYISAGYMPWFNVTVGRVGYDPIYSWASTTYIVNDPGWTTRIRETYVYRVRHVEARPARTFLAEERRIERRQELRDQALARTLHQTAAEHRAEVRLEKVDQARRAELAKTQRQLTELRELRSQREAEQARAKPQGGARPAVRRVEMPNSPIAATPGGAAAPRAHQPSPRPETAAEHRPQPRAAGAPAHKPAAMSRPSEPAKAQAKGNGAQGADHRPGPAQEAHRQALAEARQRDLQQAMRQQQDRQQQQESRQRVEQQQQQQQAQHRQADAKAREKSKRDKPR